MKLKVAGMLFVGLLSLWVATPAVAAGDAGQKLQGGLPEHTPSDDIACFTLGEIPPIAMSSARDSFNREERREIRCVFRQRPQDGTPPFTQSIRAGNNSS